MVDIRAVGSSRCAAAVRAGDMEAVMSETVLDQVERLTREKYELLAALKSILPYWDSHRQGDCGVNCTVCKARAVVSKAEGR